MTLKTSQIPPFTRTQPPRGTLLNYKWIFVGLALISFGIGATLFFCLKATYEGFELMTAMTVAILCLRAFHSIFTWRMLFLSLLIVTPVSLVFQCLAVKNQIWVYGKSLYYLGRVPFWQLDMPWMEVVFYFLFPIFQLSLFAFFYCRFPPRTLIGSKSRILPILLLLVPLSFFAQGLFLQFNPWQSGARSIDWNCAIMGTAFAVILVSYALSNAYRRFVRSVFFMTWTFGMAIYMFFWEYFHTVLHDHWRYVLQQCLFPPWIIIDPMRGHGLSQAQVYGYFMTATVFPALTFLVALSWKKTCKSAWSNPNLIPK